MKIYGKEVLKEIQKRQTRRKEIQNTERPEKRRRKRCGSGEKPKFHFGQVYAFTCLNFVCISELAKQPETTRQIKRYGSTPFLYRPTYHYGKYQLIQYEIDSSPKPTYPPSLPLVLVGCYMW